MEYPLRYIARIIIEAQSPISIQSGEKGLLSDDQIMRDWNGLPTLPGTSLMGVLRSHLEKEQGVEKLEQLKSILGGQILMEKGAVLNGIVLKEAQKVNIGSRLIISDALLCGQYHKVYTIPTADFGPNEAYFDAFKTLPIRDRVRMNERGVSDSEGSGKFDEELIFKGTRFKFELELIGNESDEDFWQELFTLIQTEWQIGGGTRNGHGQLKIIETEKRTFDLRKDLVAYQAYSSDLDQAIEGGDKATEIIAHQAAGWYKYVLDLQPADLFFHFGSGKGNQITDNTPKTERIIVWNGTIPEVDTTERYLIPASSIKGALAHRTAYHYNLIKGHTIEKVLQEVLQEKKAKIKTDFQVKGQSITTLTESDLNPYLENISKEVREKYTGDNNPAKKLLFGYAKQNEEGMEEGQIGHVIVEDVYLAKEDVATHIVDHVKIDTFSGAAFDGALFNEEVVEAKSMVRFIIKIKQKDLTKIADEAEKQLWKDSYKAIELAIFNIAEGFLPLGGMTQKGHGAFQGDLNMELSQL